MERGRSDQELRIKPAGLLQDSALDASAVLRPPIGALYFGVPEVVILEGETLEDRLGGEHFSEDIVKGAGIVNFRRGAGTV